MFQKGDFIVYGNAGVCRVEEVGHPDGIRNIDGGRLYYTLAPQYQTGVIYAPVDTPVFMRPVLSAREAEELIDRIPSIREDGYSSQKLLSDHYRGFLETHQCEDLVQLIKTVYGKSRQFQQNGRKPRQVDQHYLKRAEELLYGEFAVALGIGAGEVVGYISDRVGGAPARADAQAGLS